MQDMLALGEAWFESQRREHLAVTVNYQPQVGLARDCRATLITGRWDAVDSAGQIVRVETRDFFIHVDELAQDPQRGDLVLMVENGVTRTYRVSIPDGSRQAWQWSDRSERLRRIHTMAVARSSAQNVILLVRAAGVSSSASMTDAQIKSQLTLDLGQNRVMSRQLFAAAQYLYVVLPDSYGGPIIKANGFLSSAWELTTRSITFDGQAARAYRIYRSTYAVTGTVLVEVA